MKKKIRDLTLMEASIICAKHPLCENCPLVNKSFGCNVNPAPVLKQYWDEEIEVEDDDY